MKESFSFNEPQNTITTTKIKDATATKKHLIQLNNKQNNSLS